MPGYVKGTLIMDLLSAFRFSQIVNEYVFAKIAFLNLFIVAYSREQLLRLLSLTIHEL